MTAEKRRPIDTAPAFVVDVGDPSYTDIRKGVAFIGGVGIIDHWGVMQQRPDMYGYGGSMSEEGFPRPVPEYAAFDLRALAQYFDAAGFRVRECTEAEAAAMREKLQKGERVDAEPRPGPKAKQKPGRKTKAE